MDAPGRPRLAALRGLSALLLVAACAGSSVSVTEMAPGARLPEVTPKYDRALAAIQQGDFDHVAGRPDATSWERALAAALRDVETGRFDEADRALRRLAAAGPDDVRESAAEAHVCLLFQQARWAEVVRLHPDAAERAGILPLARHWADAPPERVTFTTPVATLPATLEDVDAPFVNVHVGGHSYRFLIDTGATFTLITSGVAEEAGIPLAAGDADIGTSTTRRLSVRPSVLPRLSVGNAVFENHPCLVTDPEDMKFGVFLFSTLRIDGVLGWNAIQSLDVLVDFRVPEVTIRAPRPRAAERNLFWLGKPVVRAHLADGLPILAGLDTGASRSDLLPPFFEILPEEYRAKMAGRTRTGSKRVWGAGGSERMPVRTVERLAVVLDGHLLEFRNLPSGRSAPPPILRPVLQFGNDIALEGTMRIDFRNGALELGP